MLKHLYLVIIATFIFGFICGGLIYFASNVGKEGDGSLSKQTHTFTISAQMYGECKQGNTDRCLSYRVTDTGAYTFLATDTQGNVISFKGELLSAEIAQLEKYIEQGMGAVYSLTDNSCENISKGVAFTYTVNRLGKDYAYDSCKSNLKGKEFFDALEKYFDTFANIHRDR